MKTTKQIKSWESVLNRINAWRRSKKVESVTVKQTDDDSFNVTHKEQ